MDLSKLREICDTGNGIDEALLVQLLGMFLADNRDRVRALRTAVEAQELELTRQLAHTIAGSVGTAGAFTLSEMARAIESEAWSGRLPEPDALAAVEAEFTRVEGVVLTSYPSLNPLV